MEDWDKINAVQRMQNYIVSHIDEEITLQDLCDTAGYSQWHSAKIFKELTNKTPFEFIRSIRLTTAAKTLRDSDEKVIDIALKTHFDSHDGFTRAFARQFEITPLKYHKEKLPIKFFTYNPIRHYYLLKNNIGDEKMEKAKVSSIVTVTVVEYPERKLILRRAKQATEYFSYCEEIGCDLEGVFNSIPERLYNSALLELPKSMVTSGTTTCASGIEVPIDYDKLIPKGCDVIELPACKMMHFIGMPFENDDDFREAIGIVFHAIENYNPEQFGYSYADDLAPRFNFGASTISGARMAVPVK